MRKFDLSLKNESFFLKIFIERDTIMSRNAITGAEGKKNNPVLNILISLIKMFEIL